MTAAQEVSLDWTSLTSYAVILGGGAGRSAGDERGHLHSVAVTSRAAEHLHHRRRLPAARLGHLSDRPQSQQRRRRANASDTPSRHNVQSLM